MDDKITLGRLDDEILYYSKKSLKNHNCYNWLKAAEIIIAALVPLTAAFNGPAMLMGSLGATVVIIEGILSLYQFQSTWITYRSTAEELKHEKYLYLARAGPYMNIHEPAPLLAERVEALISREHACWVSLHEQVPREKENKPHEERIV
jgi:hypothetical protein